jgi:hypothetical protein
MDFLLILNEQTIDGDVITIHNKAFHPDIAAPAHLAATARDKTS